MLFLSAVLFPVFLGISLIIDDGGPMIIPFLVFFAALVMLLYSRLFLDKSSPVIIQQEPSSLAAMTQRTALPPPSNIPMHGVGNIGRQQVKTNELAHPPSVTEHTTKLLDNE